MLNNWIPIAIVTLYVVVLFAVTGWARRLTDKGGGGIVGYLLAGRELPYWVAAALLAGLAVGGVSTIGTAEWAYSRGISAGWYNAAWAAGAFMSAPSAGTALPPPRDHDLARAVRAALQRHAGACSE